MNKVVVFDLDDTLYKEIDYLTSAYQEIADWLETSYDKRNVFPLMLQYYKQGNDVFGSINQYFALGIPHETYLHKYRAHLPHISLTDEIENMLSALSARGYVLGVITDGRELTQHNKFNALRLDRYINEDDCVISESFGYAKPSPEGYAYFQDKYPDAQYYYVGDNVKKDFIAPNQLGWTTICLKDDGRNIHKQVEVIDDLRAKYLIGKMSELISIVSEK